MMYKPSDDRKGCTAWNTERAGLRSGEPARRVRGEQLLVGQARYAGRRGWTRRCGPRPGAAQLHHSDSHSAKGLVKKLIQLNDDIFCRDVALTGAKATFRVILRKKVSV